MKKSSNHARRIPILILDAANDPENWEPKAVQAKFRLPDAVIGEENVDYVALGYMNAGAVLYWLPRFLKYLRSDAPGESFHFESMLAKLSNANLVSDFRDDATPEELADVRDYLAWFGHHPLMVEAPDLRQAQCNLAVELWK